MYLPISFRFRDIDHLYLTFMLERIGGPEKLRAVAKHRSLETTVRLVESCCHTATKLDLDAWHDGALDVLKEILCYCCYCHPAYLTALREDSLLMLTEVHREYLRDYTPLLRLTCRCVHSYNVPLW